MCKGMASPPQTSVLEQWRQPYRDGVLTREDMEKYWNEGYLVKHDLIPAELLDAVKQAISRSASHATAHIHSVSCLLTWLCEGQASSHPGPADNQAEEQTLTVTFWVQDSGKGGAAAVQGRQDQGPL